MGGQHTPTSLVRWGCPSPHGMALRCCHHKVSARIQIAGDTTVIQRWRGQHLRQTVPFPHKGSSPRPAPTGRRAQLYNPWPWRAKPAGGQCRHSGNSLIRFQSLSSVVVVSLLQPTHWFPPASAPDLCATSSSRPYKIQPRGSSKTIALLLEPLSRHTPSSAKDRWLRDPPRSEAPSR